MRQPTRRQLAKTAMALSDEAARATADRRRRPRSDRPGAWPERHSRARPPRGSRTPVASRSSPGAERDGAEKHIMDSGIAFAATATRNEGVQVTGKLGMAGPHPMVEHFKFVAAHTQRTPKITIPAPSAIYGRPSRTPIDKQAYPDMDKFWLDLGANNILIRPAGCAPGKVIGDRRAGWLLPERRRCHRQSARPAHPRPDGRRLHRERSRTRTTFDSAATHSSADTRA